MVGHIINTFLFKTGSWIYSQIQFQPCYPSIILSLELENQEQFPYDKIFSLQNLSKRRQYWERIIRKSATHYYPYFYHVSREEGVQLLHAHFGTVGLNNLSLARSLGVPLITSFYGADMSMKLDNGLELSQKYKELFKSGTLFLVEGPAAKQQLLLLGCPQEKIKVYRLGVDVGSNCRQAPQNPISDKIRVLMAATFTEKKGMSYGIEAFCQAAQENDRLHLTVVGDARSTKPEEFKIKENLHQIVHRYQMSERVNFLGFIKLKQLDELAHQHNIFLHPSVTAKNGDNEGGSPVVITEMQAAGLPVIASRHCDIPQAVIDQETGFLAEERDVTQLKSSLLQLADDPQLRLRMGRQAIAHIRDQFDARKQGILLGKIYQEIIG